MSCMCVNLNNSGYTYVQYNKCINLQTETSGDQYNNDCFIIYLFLFTKFKIADLVQVDLQERAGTKRSRVVADLDFYSIRGC